MKIRLDFVTNSSSTSSAIALASGVAGIFVGLALTSCQCSDPGKEDDSEEDGGGPEPSLDDEAIDAALAASEKAAQEAADRMAADAAAKDELIKNVLDSETQKLDATATKLQDEINKYKDQWKDAQQGADTGDPGYTQLKTQYDDYIDYLKGQLDQVNAQKYEVEVAQVEETLAKESRNEWVNQRQQDLVQVQEQKAFLQAVATGYGKDGNYEIGKVQDQLQQLERREQELRNTLKENNAEIDYTPKERGEIGPDPEMARLNQEYKQKMQGLQQEANAARDARNETKRAELTKEMGRLEQDMANQARKATFWDVMTKTAETTQVVADVGVDVLSNVTGPYGKTVKTCYTGLKGLAGGFGEGLANGDMSKNIIKGGVGGLSDIAKDKIGDKFGKAAQNIYTIGSEAGKSMVESGLDGKTSVEDMVKAGLTGATKGSLDATVNIVSDSLLPSGAEMPAGLDWSDINVKNFVNSVKSSNPLTVRNIGREAIGNSLQSTGVDQFKNLIKGDNVIFSGVNQEATGQVLDQGTSLAARKYAPYVTKTMNSVGTAVKNSGKAMSSL